MALLHHYSTSTCYTISMHPMLQMVWRIRVPQVGFSFHFVLRAILALAALHLAHLKPENRAHYVAEAEFHHNMALQMASAVLSNITEENAPAIYLFSTLTSIISCAKPRLPDDCWMIGDRDIEWLTLFRGTWFIIESAENAIKTSVLSPIFINGIRRRRAREAKSTTNMSFLDDLRRLLKETVMDAKELACYLDAVDEMSKSFATIADVGPDNCQTADVFVWILETSEDYLRLLRERKPEALVIFSYFCVITKALEWAWWMQGLSTHLIEGIYRQLSEEHRCWLQWPMEQLGWIPRDLTFNHVQLG
ncbi:hypothetical protein ARAM_001191 [Aspergillus rambellii]|uniref:C6 transcription factor n=3 Tax=Aspergillus subgen. Nidulantes TaxID=2720870 RepID=A0A0F8X537_9EURO|nr:hypothetical protein AOCH_007800 [Aspergillus ochraceoroseus]KKK18687.1 hypothetical protein ARAM_001191 [Aspergillus rambellii]